ncbi:class B sortase [Oscillibacter sp.]|uniref:class B sortase n=1 Tax=Oscillibacter sp. TaxID=1945593 RepID=UPI0028993746|nr:class B sortase [Oscillibacter sp.]
MARGKKLLSGAFLLLLVISVSAIGHSLLADYRTQSQTQQLAQLHSPPPESTVPPSEMTGPEAVAEGPEEPVMLEQFHALYEQNPDIMGWLKINGTRIDYPVMQSGEDPEFYLEHDFEKQANKNGVPFLDTRYSPEGSDVLLIHGHNMKNGLMFSDLLRYKEESYYQLHPTIRFDTLYEEGEYEIIAVILAPALYEGQDGFRYYETEAITTSAAFDEYLKRIQALALYKTKKAACYGDRLIILSTCEYSQENGRLAVLAKK